METTLHLNEYKFQENKKITKTDWRIDLCKISEKLLAAEFPSVDLLVRLN